MDFGPKETCARLTAASARELELVLEALFENPVRIPGTGMAEAPIIGTPYIVALDHSMLLPPIFRAVRVKEKFRKAAPGWPDLPLRSEDCEALYLSGDNEALTEPEPVF